MRFHTNIDWDTPALCICSLEFTIPKQPARGPRSTPYRKMYCGDPKYAHPFLFSQALRTVDPTNNPLSSDRSGERSQRANSRHAAEGSLFVLLVHNGFPGVKVTPPLRRTDKLSHISFTIPSLQ
jgi:hypothetical protein